jgi:hypothetical protein
MLRIAGEERIPKIHRKEMGYCWPKQRRSRSLPSEESWYVRVESPDYKRKKDDTPGGKGLLREMRGNDQANDISKRKTDRAHPR